MSTSGAGPRFVSVNGRLVPVDSAQLLVSDRGFQLGDGIFETMRARRGVVIECDDHLARLAGSASLLAIRLPPAQSIVAAIAELLGAEGLAGGEDSSEPRDAAVRVTVTRGPIARRGLLPAGFDSAEPTLVVQVWPYAPAPATLLERGAHAMTSAIRRDPRSPLSGVKSISRAEYVYAKLEAHRAGADEAIFLTIDGLVSEATSANVFIVSGDRLRTPAFGSAILPGTTRTWILANAAAVGLRPDQAAIAPQDLAAADEAFLSSSVAGILPLVSIDGRPIGTGAPGSRSLALREARERWIDEQSLSGAGRVRSG